MLYCAVIAVEQRLQPRWPRSGFPGLHRLIGPVPRCLRSRLLEGGHGVAAVVCGQSSTHWQVVIAWCGRTVVVAGSRQTVGGRQARAVGFVHGCQGPEADGCVVKDRFVLSHIRCTHAAARLGRSAMAGATVGQHLRAANVRKLVDGVVVGVGGQRPHLANASRERLFIRTHVLVLRGPPCPPRRLPQALLQCARAIIRKLN